MRWRQAYKIVRLAAAGRKVNADRLQRAVVVVSRDLRHGRETRRVLELATWIVCQVTEGMTTVLREVTRAMQAFVDGMKGLTGAFAAMGDRVRTATP